jgi:hypothetical protein
MFVLDEEKLGSRGPDYRSRCSSVDLASTGSATSPSCSVPPRRNQRVEMRAKSKRERARQVYSDLGNRERGKRWRHSRCTG